ncbi:MAG: hypothetical protein AABY15_04460 [Nanoarchaeota archaeon]
MKTRIWIRRKDRIKQRYWVGKKPFHAHKHYRKWDDKYPEVDTICPKCGTKNWSGVGRMKGKGTIAQCGICGYVDKADRFVHSRTKQLESKNFGSIRGLTIPELSSKAKKVTEEGSIRLKHSPPIFKSTTSESDIGKTKFVIPGHVLTVLKSRSEKERVLTSKLGDKFVTISSNPYSMVGFESDTEKEAEKVHKRLENEAEDRIK